MLVYRWHICYVRVARTHNRIIGYASFSCHQSACNAVHTHIRFAMVQSSFSPQPLSVRGWTLVFLFNFYRLCGTIKGRFRQSLSCWLRTGWQSMITQEKIPRNTPPWPGIGHGRTDSELSHWSTMIAIVNATYMCASAACTAYVCLYVTYVHTVSRSVPRSHSFVSTESFDLVFPKVRDFLLACACPITKVWVYEQASFIYQWATVLWNTNLLFALWSSTLHSLIWDIAR